jgi:phage FluMu gp28-like protein
MGNKAHDLWTQNFDPQNLRPKPGALWSCHYVPIDAAIADGLPFDREEMREALADEEAWAQEYMLSFLDTYAVLLPYEVIMRCESENDFVTAEENQVQRHCHREVAGIDFGRSKNLTVAWSLDASSKPYRTISLIELANKPTNDQEQFLAALIRRCSRVVFDYTGPGIGLGDYLAGQFGRFDPKRHQYGKMELLTINNETKVSLFSKLRMAFDAQQIVIPKRKEIREDLHSVHRCTTPAGRVTYSASQSPSGHADRASALALALRAAESPTSGCSWQAVQLRDYALLGEWPKPNLPRRFRTW